MREVRELTSDAMCMVGLLVCSHGPEYCGPAVVCNCGPYGAYDSVVAVEEL